ncbi:hypothetical protein J4N45_26065 [Vibrio sp. SCSIO 43140]|uniref:hypothetical protein n=1 Tax=Vibrio sp. SCSIO 43140 TaxID=2819100 RepID=UPI0020757B3A|nr:hypothetical protein [Vibrio sp. SCSIO 43140]USD62825.1 hypothetical protein J4N45_26065 [Vibrio sp. SCSIO 43140]
MSNTDSKPFTEQHLQNTLEKIVSHPLFYSSPKLVAFLQYIVEKAEAGLGDELTQYGIATELFGKPTSFDPSSDPMVRMLATKLRKSLAVFFEDNPNCQVLIELPKRSYTPILSLNGSYLPEPTLPDTHYPTIAVLPFSLTSQDELCVDLTNSLQEELNHALGRFDQLAVLSPLRIQEVSEGSISLSELRRLLGARYVISGSVRRNSMSTRITIALSETDQGIQIWSERFELMGELGSLGEQERIVQKMATKIGSSYGVISMHEFQAIKHHDKTVLNDYQARLFYLEYLTKMSQESLQDMIALYEELTLERYANDARMLATLAQLYCDALLFGIMDQQQVIERCEKLVAKALDFSPHDSEVILAQAWWALLTNNEQKVKSCAERIIQLNPNSHYTIGAAGWLVCLSGNFDYGIRILTDLLGKDEYFPNWLKLSQALNAIRQQDMDAALQSIELFYVEGNVLQTILLALIYQVTGHYAFAEQHWSEANGMVSELPRISEQLLKVMILDKSLCETLEKARQILVR